MDTLVLILHIISGPIIGGVIGWLTNYLAVKMLFHPYNPVTIGKIKIPLTPGIIPKRRHDLAHAIGDAVQGTLLTRDDLKGEFMNMGGVRLREWMASIKVGDLMDQSDRSILLDALEDMIYGKLLNASHNEELNVFIEDKIIAAVKKKLSGNPLAMLVSEKTIRGMVKGQLSNLLEETTTQTEDEAPVNTVRLYIRNKLEELTDKDLQSLILKDIPDTSEMIPAIMTDEEYQIILVQEAWNRVLSHVLEGAAGFMLDRLNVSKMIEEKIDAMPMRDLETLILSVMKKELNAIVNLGALIGFLIGVINVFL